MSDTLENIKATDELMPMSLADFETPLIQGNYPAAEKVLQLLMQNQRKGKMEFSLRPANRKLTQAQTDTEAFQVIEKITTLLTTMFSDTKYIASEGMFNEFVMAKGFLADLFAASSYQNTDHIIRNLGLDTKGSYTKEDIRRFLMLYVPDSTYDLPWLKLAHYMPSEVSRAYLGLMSSSGLLMTEMSNIRLNELAKVAKELPVITYSRPENLELMSNGYFHVSNFNGADKYEFKKWAVKNYQKFMQEYLSIGLQKSIANKVLKKPRHEKQRILIIHEHYREGHAMYRCYHSLISALKNQYHVVGMSAKNLVDEIGRSDHDEFIEHENAYDFESIIKAILKLQPDMIFYPSVGMSSFVPLLASQRLAPLQLMTPGHPSSSMIDTIDYMLYFDIGVEKSVIQKFWSEKVDFITGKLNGMTVADFTIEPVKQASDTIKIAVNGVVPKVTNELITTCQKITAGTTKPIEFQFFLNSPKQDLGYYSGLSTLRRSLPNSKIHFYQDYNAYINILAQCSFAIPTFPFGGSNSNIDCLRVCLPKLFVIDDRSYVGYTDYQIWNGIDMLEGYCESIDSLIARSIEFIDNPEKMKEFKSKMKAFDLKALDQSAINENMTDNRLNDKFSELLDNIKPSS